MKLYLIILVLLSCLNSIASSELSFEAGGVHNSYNLQRSPNNDNGTTFDLASGVDEFNSFYRLNLKLRNKKNSGLRFLYAPLKLSGEQRFNKNTQFENDVFLSSQDTETFYQFNSYRVSYFFNLKNSKKFLMDLGATLKVRDAKVRLKQGSKSELIENIGVVPLFYFYTEYLLTPHTFLSFDFDGLIAPQGRAFDTALFLGKSFSKNFRTSLGLRILEGGADNEKVYNAALFSFYSLKLDFIF